MSLRPFAYDRPATIADTIALLLGTPPPSAHWRAGPICSP